MGEPEDIQYQEALRRYQVDVAKYEQDAKKYKEAIRDLQDGDIRPSRPIPPIPPIKPMKLSFASEDANPGTFNEGIDAAAFSLDCVGEKELANWVRKQKR